MEQVASEHLVLHIRQITGHAVGDDQVGLGGALALDRTTISVVVKKLEQRGLVERSVSEKDRRSKPVSITEDGARLIRDVLPAAETAQDRMLAPLTAAERAQFMRLLGKVATGNNSESRAPLRARGRHKCILYSVFCILLHESSDLGQSVEFHLTPRSP